MRNVSFFRNSKKFQSIVPKLTELITCEEVPKRHHDAYHDVCDRFLVRYYPVCWRIEEGKEEEKGRKRRVKGGKRGKPQNFLPHTPASYWTA